MISIIVPAYNESTVIARALAAITAGAKRDEIDVIVVCNGCTDDTASKAREFGPPIRVIETSVGNKAHALNVGDKAARSFPRIYADSDVVISLDTIRAIAARFERGDALAVACVFRNPIATPFCKARIWRFWRIRTFGSRTPEV